MILAALHALLLVQLSAMPVAPAISTRATRGLIRVPRQAPAEPEVRWRAERGGPRCIPARALAGASVADARTVDLILRGNERVRATLDRRCSPLDFYSGFYIRPHPDGRICADRDVIRSRAGGTCEIDRLQRLVPQSPRRR